MHQLRATSGVAMVAFAAALTRCGSPAGPADQPTLPESLSGSFAMVDVTVIPMTGPRLLHQSILVDGSKITALGNTDAVVVPPSATVIPLPAGTVVTPGLADMHTHAFDRDELLLYLANGVTTIRNLHGLRRHLAWRDSIALGRMVGPRILTAGPILDGDPPTRSTNVVIRTPAEAEAAVNEQADLGFDYIKIYDNLPRPLYQAIGAAARRRHIWVTGHLPTPVGLDGLFADGVQSEVQHLEEFLPFLADGRDATMLDSIARGLARAGIVVVPTVSVYASARDQAVNLASLRGRPEMAFVNPATARDWGWDPTAAGRSGQPGAIERYQRVVAFFEREMLPRLHQAGVVLVAGTDAPIPMIIPGFGIHDELAAYARAGLSNDAVLAIATVNAARVLPPATAAALPGFGTIAAGGPADLLVLSADPTSSIDNLRTARIAVVAHGRWYSQTRIQRSLDSLAAAYSGASR